jgi:hypothetical protein
MPTWGDEEIELLINLWSDLSITSTEIGRRLGKTKNAVIGKARNSLKLPPRESYRNKPAKPCVWRLWPVSDNQPRHCGKEALPGSNYCAEHAARVRIIPRGR